MPSLLPQNPIPGKLILASASPRRREILEAAGFEFDVLPTVIPELPKEGEPAAEFVMRMATEKAQVARDLAPQPCLVPVLAADTVVVLDERALGKPASAEEARWLLRLLSGRSIKF